jgi:hypothetical protein
MSSGEFFQSKREDGRSLSRVAFEYISAQMESGAVSPGHIFRHDELADEMETTYPSSAYFQAVNKAINMLQRKHHRSLTPVRGVGYKLVEGMAMVDKGRNHHQRGRRQISKAIATTSSIDEASLETMDQRTQMRMALRGFIMIGNIIDQQAEKLAEHEADIAELKDSRLDDRARYSATEAQMANMKRRLEALETKPPTP